jgi:hypothetical protein
MEEEKMTEHESVVLEWSVSEAWISGDWHPDLFAWVLTDPDPKNWTI